MPAALPRTGPCTCMTVGGGQGVPYPECRPYVVMSLRIARSILRCRCRGEAGFQRRCPEGALRGSLPMQAATSQDHAPRCVRREAVCRRRRILAGRRHGGRPRPVSCPYPRPASGRRAPVHVPWRPARRRLRREAAGGGARIRARATSNSRSCPCESEGTAVCMRSWASRRAMRGARRACCSGVGSS